MKKFLSVLIASVMAASMLAGCGETVKEPEEAPSAAPTETASTQIQENTDEAAEESNPEE